MQGMGNLFLAELSRAWILFRRYPIPNFAYAIITFVVFYGLFLGTRYLAGPVAMVGARLDALVVGYIVWTLSLSALADISLNLQEDMQGGTLEHVYLSPFGPTRIYLMRGLAKLIINLAVTLVVALVIMFAVDHWLQWRWELLPAAALTLISAYGFSMCFGAMTLVYKRLGGLFGLIQFLLLYLVLAPVEELPLTLRPLSALLPIAPTVSLLRQVLSESEPAGSYEIALSVGNALLYMGVGLFLFQRADRAMRARGTVSQF
jgi:ABC-2 type transport system permease protein